MQHGRFFYVLDHLDNDYRLITPNEQRAMLKCARLNASVASR